MSVPVHVGVIMDGNGRWAKKRGLPRKFGHREGAKTFRAITRHAKALGIQYITYYAFSTENWKRPKDEVDAIMDLFEKYLDEVRDFIEENIRVRFIGDRTRLSENLQRKMASVEEDSKDFDSMTLVLAINYGGRDEICHAAKTLAQQVENKNLEIESVSQDLNEILLEIAQKQQQKSFQQQNIQRIAEEIRRLEQEKAQILHDSANSCRSSQKRPFSRRQNWMKS